ncbi:tetratricopeptide repeat protein [Streptomyces microflavus]|uniref:tetratricopeptide repeat protein n=1 Tax=Streptomyces microflavus TaxID=1919 RepID=UPI00368AA7FC
MIEAAHEDGEDVVLAQPVESGRVLVGEGGVGKSQMAASYYLDSDADLAVWTTAKGGTEQLIADFAEAAARIGAPGANGEDDRHDAEALLEWLQATDRSWLLVIDDIQDLDQILEWWPSPRPRGWVLATTRQRKALGAGRTRIDVDVFTEAEAQSYLHERIPGLPRHSDSCDECLARPIAELLGRLPLALSHAAAYLDNNRDTTPAAYARMLAEPGRPLAETLPGDGADGYARAVHTTMLINLTAVETQEARPGLARAVMDTVAQLDPNGSPAALWTDPTALGILTGPSPQWWQRLLLPRVFRDIPRAITGLRGVPADQIRACLLLLDRYSLTTYQPSGKNAETGLVRIHALTARAIRDTTLEKQRHPLALRTAQALFALWPDGGHDMALQQILRANTTALHEVTTPALFHPYAHAVLFRAGTSLGETGQPAAARDHFIKLSNATTHHLGLDHLDTLTTRGNLARWRGETGEVDAAVEAYTALVKDCTRVLGPDHPETLTTRNNLASWLAKSGNEVAAIEAFTTLVEERIRVLGPDHPETLTTRGNLIGWRAEVEGPAGTVEAFAELVEDCTRVLGEDHPDTLNARNNLVGWRAEVEGPAGTVEAFAELVEDYTRVLGEDHPETLNIRIYLARWRGEVEDAAKAVSAFAKLVDDHTRVLGPDHLATLATRSNLSRWQGEEGNPADAIETCTALVEDCTRALGPDHPNTLLTRTNLAHWRGEAGDAEGAVEAYAAVLGDYIQVLGPDHPDTLATRGNHARWMAEAGDTAGAVEALAALVEDCTRVLGPDHPHTLIVKDNLVGWRGEADETSLADREAPSS